MRHPRASVARVHARILATPNLAPSGCLGAPETASCRAPELPWTKDAGCAKRTKRSSDEQVFGRRLRRLHLRRDR